MHLFLLQDVFGNGTSMEPAILYEDGIGIIACGYYTCNVEIINIGLHRFPVMHRSNTMFVLIELDSNDFSSR